MATPKPLAGRGGTTLRTNTRLTCCSSKMFPSWENCHPLRPSPALMWGPHRCGEVLRACILLTTVPPAGGRYPEAVTAAAKPLQLRSLARRRRAEGGVGAPQVWPAWVESGSHPGCGCRGGLLRPLLPSPPESFPIPAPQTPPTSPRGPKLSCFSLLPPKPPLPSLVHL